MSSLRPSNDVDVDVEKSEPVTTECACDGVSGPVQEEYQPISAMQLFKSLSLLDRMLAPLVLLSMIVGILIGVYAESGVHRTFNNSATWEGVSIPILIGLLLMIWPPLAKVQWERLPVLFKTRTLWMHLGLSFVLNWLFAPLVMLALAWATLPEAALERERKGVLLVGVERFGMMGDLGWVQHGASYAPAMVLIWNTISQGDAEYCAILVVFNSLLQVILFAPYAALFLNHLGGSGGQTIPLAYTHAARSVGIYLGLPLAAGILTRLLVLHTLQPAGRTRFFALFGPVAVLGLLYTIVVLFADQGRRIVDDVGRVFRICVPLVLYFATVWTTTFLAFWALSRSRYAMGGGGGGYERAVTQAFTAGSNNPCSPASSALTVVCACGGQFELAIAVGIASFGTEAPEVLAATLGPLVEVPVLLALSYVALYLRGRMRWAPESVDINANMAGGGNEKGIGAGEKVDV
ncbi:arsenical-resistance protein [Dentipellis sp. KUC8613]|nr:arsenical-resistance protein [Dentipellis sp. KUC8613]